MHGPGDTQPPPGFGRRRRERAEGAALLLSAAELQKEGRLCWEERPCPSPARCRAPRHPPAESAPRGRSIFFFLPLSLRKKGKKKYKERRQKRLPHTHAQPGRPPLPGSTHEPAAALRSPGQEHPCGRCPAATPAPIPAASGLPPAHGKGLSHRERLFPSRPAPARSQQGPAVTGARLPPGPPKCPAEGRGCSRSAGNPAGY